MWVKIQGNAERPNKLDLKVVNFSVQDENRDLNGNGPGDGKRNSVCRSQSERHIHGHSSEQKHTGLRTPNMNSVDNVSSEITPDKVKNSRKQSQESNSKNGHKNRVKKSLSVKSFREIVRDTKILGNKTKRSRSFCMLRPFICHSGSGTLNR